MASNLIQSEGYTNVIAASSSFGKDVIPRIGGKLDLQAITDVIEIRDGGAQFVRPIYAGNALCAVSTKDPTRLLTVRGTNFEKVKVGDAADVPSEELDGVVDVVGELGGQWIEN